MCSSIVLYLTFIPDNSLPFYAWKQEWVYIFYVASITEKKNRYHDLPSCIIMTCDRHLPLLSHVICHLLSHVICHCHLTSSAIVISRHLPLSSHVICHWHLTVVNFATSLTTFEVIYLSSTTFSIIVYRCAFACLFSLKLIFFLLNFHLCIGYFTIVILCVSWDRQHMFFLKNIVNQTIINNHQR